MNPLKVVGILLLIAGGLALAYGGFTYTDTHKGNIGPVELTVKEKDFFSIPVWAGLGALVAGGLLLVIRQKR